MAACNGGLRDRAQRTGSRRAIGQPVYWWSVTGCTNRQVLIGAVLTHMNSSTDMTLWETMAAVNDVTVRHETARERATLASSPQLVGSTHETCDWIICILM